MKWQVDKQAWHRLSGGVNTRKAFVYCKQNKQLEAFFFRQTRLVYACDLAARFDGGVDLENDSRSEIEI